MTEYNIYGLILYCFMYRLFCAYDRYLYGILILFTLDVLLLLYTIHMLVMIQDRIQFIILYISKYVVIITGIYVWLSLSVVGIEYSYLYLTNLFLFLWRATNTTHIWWLWISHGILVIEISNLVQCLVISLLWIINL